MGEKKIDFDNDPVARRNLKQIFEEESRYLFPHEVAYILCISLSEVYQNVPRAPMINSSVRFDAAVVKRIKAGLSLIVESSLKIEKKTKNVGLPKTQKMRKGKADLCL